MPLSFTVPAARARLPADTPRTGSVTSTYTAHMNQVSKHKMAVIIWIAIYPSVNLLFFLLGDWLATLPMLLRTLVLTLVLVPLMVYVLLPGLTRLFRPWLTRP
ncbi:MAG: hypothetical protein OHK0039_49260 [Bacteroidia bacterium]